ncbi:MAG: ribonuclease [Lachnospiraceae bacterium]|nr:ribonuclease [Lachnospiraceae bacterium]
MKRKWKYLLGSFLLTAGLLLGCAGESGQPLQEIQTIENQEAENSVPEELASEDTQETEAEITTPEAPDKEPELSEDGTYTSKEEVARYLFLYGHLPDNFITKKEAKALGWVSSEGNLGEVAPGKSIGGDYFGNFEGNLPEKEGREYHECDIDSDGGYRGAKRIVYSNDGLVYYTEDHYQTFELLYGEE